MKKFLSVLMLCVLSLSVPFEAFARTEGTDFPGVLVAAARTKKKASAKKKAVKKQNEPVVKLSRQQYEEFIKICEDGSLEKFVSKMEQENVSPNATCFLNHDSPGGTITGELEESDTLLTLAAERTSNPGIITYLLSKGADIHKPAPRIETETFVTEGRTAIMSAHFPQVLQTLLDAGAKVNEADSRGYTPLMNAARIGIPENIKILLSAGANVNAKTVPAQDYHDTGYDTALMIAASNGNTDCVKLLLQAGAEVNARNDEGWTALIYAARYSKHPAEIINALLEAGAEIDTKGPESLTALAIAAWNNNAEAVETLLKAGANAKIRNDDNKRPIDLAREDNNLKGTEALRLLIDASYESTEERDKEEAKYKAAFQSVVQKAEEGDAQAQYELGYMYLNGTYYVDEDGNQAVFWLKKSAEQGHTEAMAGLGTIYRAGEAGIKKDDKEADFWFEKRRMAIQAQQKNTFQTNGVITGNKVNVRAAPNTSAKVIKQLNAGHPIKATHKTKKGDWYLIQTASGTKGWVFGKYVKLQ